MNLHLVSEVPVQALCLSGDQMAAEYNFPEKKGLQRRLRITQVSWPSAPQCVSFIIGMTLVLSQVSIEQKWVFLLLLDV